MQEKQGILNMISPVYLTIVDDIKEKIFSGAFKTGDVIPSEALLCNEYSTSRMTVRKGLAILVSEGYIYSIPGKGYFVHKPEGNKYTLIYDEMHNSINSVDKTKLLEVNIIMPDEKLVDSLKISKSSNLILIRRLLFTNGEAVAYDVKYLKYQKGMPILEKEIEDATFPEMFSKDLPQFSLKKELVIYAQAPDDEIKKILMIYNELPLLVVEQKIFSGDKKPIGLGITYFRGDYIKLIGIS